MTRINKFIAELSGISRRSADKLISSGEILVNGKVANAGYQVRPNDKVTSKNPKLKFDHHGSEKPEKILVMINKPAGYVCSRSGQGSKTIYDLLPKKYHRLKPVGRLDKESSGLLLMTNDGELANKLTHPKYQKDKLYLVKLDKPLAQKDKTTLLKGVKLDDGLSKFTKVKYCSNGELEVTIREGRNRQIRRSMSKLGYQVTDLHRTELGPYRIDTLKTGTYEPIEIS